MPKWHFGVRCVVFPESTKCFSSFQLITWFVLDLISKGIKMRIPSLNEFTTRRRNRMIDSVPETGKSRTEPDNQIQILFVQCSHIALWLHSLAFHLISNSISVKLRKRRSFEHFFLYSNFMQIPRSSFKGRKRWKWVCEPNAGEIFLSAARHVQSG